MPREVFAEEIEAFLERLDAVAAVRVVANEAGDIERIYVTTESARDDGGIRRAITSALMSQFNLPVDGWRVQIAHLQPTPDTERIPASQLVRLEETMTETMTNVIVELRYEREGAQKTLTGTAQAPPGQSQRLRTVALAAVEALRPLIERSGYRPSLEALSVMQFAGAAVALAALTLTSERTSLLHVGAEAVTSSEAEAVVGAVMDAAQKPPRRIEGAGKVRLDRRQQFEGLRAHYERLIRAEAGAGSPASPEEAPPTGAAQDEPPATEEPSRSPGHEPLRGESWQAHAVGAAAEDVIHDMSEIRPERQGGATVMREEIRTDGPTGTKAPPRPSLEDAFYRRLVGAATPVYIRCRDGYEIPSAIVKDFGTYSLLIENNGTQELLFKHGIIAIRPYGPLPPESGAPS
ncbi:MAG: hypothetical protein ACT4PY_02075 [Armatimonadota bacterium]